MFQHSWIHVITVMHVSANTMDLIYYKKLFLTNDLYLSRKQIVMQIYPLPFLVKDSIEPQCIALHCNGTSVARKTLQESFNFVQRSESETQEKMVIFLSDPNSQERHLRSHCCKK